MRNRRIIGQHLEAVGSPAEPSRESNSMILLISDIRTGMWDSIVPLNLAKALGVAESIRAIPI